VIVLAVGRSTSNEPVRLLALYRGALNWFTVGEARAEEPDVELDVSAATAAGRPDTLPMRKRGTRVWIFCSKFLTRARISETICTPLLRGFETLLEVVVFRRVGELPPKVGRESGVRALPSAGVVLERARPDGLELVPDESGRGDPEGKPVRRNAVDCPS
jgi:hypothetical protein